MNGMDEQLRSMAPQMLFIIDEFHKTMNATLRTSITLDVVKLSADFIGLSGTIIKDTNHKELIQWLEQIVEFEVTENNYWVAVGALISRKIPSHVTVERQYVETPLLNPSKYYSLVPSGLGGTSPILHFKEAVNECYDAITEAIVFYVIEYVKAGEGVFVVAKDAKNQITIRDKLIAAGIQGLHLITKDTPITLAPGDITNIKVVITTTRFAEGYTLSLFRVGIAGCWFSNEATREQLVGRLNRLNQRSPIVRWITIHTGILSYILKRYEAARSLSEALKGFASDIGLNDIDVLRREL